MNGNITDGRTPSPHEELTINHPTAGVTLTKSTVATVQELLALADEFLRTASPTVHAELRAYLDTQVPPADPGWFIDMLGLNATHLARQPQLTHQQPRVLEPPPWGRNS